MTDYVDKVGIRVFADTRQADRDIDRVSKRRKMLISAVLDAAKAKRELRNLDKSAVVEVTARVEAAKAKLAELRKQIQTGNDNAVQVNADISAARAKIATLRSELAKTTDKDAKIAIQADIKQAQTSITELRARLARMRNEKVQIGLDVRRASRELRDLTKEQKAKVQAHAETTKANLELIRVARDRLVNLWVRVKSSAAVAEMKRLLKGLSGLKLLDQWRESVTGLMENLPQLALKLATVGLALVGLVTPLLAAASAIAPLAASLAAIVPLAVGFIPLIAALKTIGGIGRLAFTDLDKATSKGGKRMHKAVVGIQKDFSKLRGVAQNKLFTKGLVGSFKELAATILPQAKAGVAGVASAMSKIGTTALDKLTSQLDKGGLGRFLANLTHTLNEARAGVGGFVEAVTRIALIGSKILPDLGTKITEIGQRFAAWSKTADIAGMIRGAATQFGFLAASAGSLVGIIAGVFKAMDTGRSTGLESLSRTLAAIRDVVEGAGFQSAMRIVFTGAAEGAAKLREALTPIGASLGKLAPLFGAILSTAGGALASMLTGITDALSQPIAQSGLMAALEGIGNLATSIPWSMLGAAVGILGQAIGQIAPLVTSLLQAIVPLLPPVLAAVGSLIPPLVQLVQAILPPLVAVIGGVLVPIIQALAPVISALTPLVTALAGAFMTAVYPALLGAVTIIQLLVPAITMLAGFLAGLVTAATRLLQGDWQGAWEAAQAAVSGVVSGILPLVSGLVSGIVAYLAGLGANIARVATTAWAMFKAAVSAGVSAVLSFVGSVPGRIVSALGSLGGILSGAGRAVMDGFLNGLRAAWGAVQSFVGGIADWIKAHKGPLTYDYQLLQPAGRAMMKGLGASLSDGFQDVQRLVSNFGPRLSTTFSPTVLPTVNVTASGVAALTPAAIEAAFTSALAGADLSKKVVYGDVVGDSAVDRLLDGKQAAAERDRDRAGVFL